jgi:hypothetical protein
LLSSASRSALRAALGVILRFLGGRSPVGISARSGREEIEHAVRNAVVVEEIAEDPIRYLVLGPDPAGRLLEHIVMDGQKAQP